MDADDPHLIFLRPLASAGISYMVTGSVACTIYGEPRMTLDVDLVVELDSASIPAFRALFPETGFYVPPADVLAIEAGRERRGHFNVIHGSTGSKADVYIAGRDPLHRWASDWIRRMDLNGVWKDVENGI